MRLFEQFFDNSGEAILTQMAVRDDAILAQIRNLRDVAGCARSRAAEMAQSVLTLGEALVASTAADSPAARELDAYLAAAGAAS